MRAGRTSAQVRTSWRGQGYLEPPTFPGEPEIYLSALFLSIVAFSFRNRFFFKVMVFSASRVERGMEAGRKG